MSKSTISTFQLFQMFPDAESARLYLESRLWPNGVTCPTCRKGERITTRKGGYYRCNACNLDFTVRTGTVMDRSHIPLHKWLGAMLLVAKNPDISSLALASELELTPKSASLTIKRIYEAATPLLEKHLELDKSFFRLIKARQLYRRITRKTFDIQGANRMSDEKDVPIVLDKMADIVLKYRPKEKKKKPRKRAKAEPKKGKRE